MRAVICGYYGKGNGGDEALLMSLLQMLPATVTPVVLSANPSETRQQYQVEAIPHRSAFSILKALAQGDLFIWGGGSLMQDSTSFASPFYYGGLMGLAQQKGLKTVAWAQGIGPLNRSLTRWLTQQVLLGCTAISVRDENSAKLLQNWNLSPLVAPDPVWALASSPVQGLATLPTPRVAVNLRAHSSLTPKRLEILTQALINFQKATQTSLLLLPFQAEQDLAIARSLAQPLTGEHQVLLLTDPRQLKGVFREVDMTIGMRLHSLIMAAAEGCRCFALSYDPKVNYLMQAINLAGWELSHLPDDPDTISQAWIDCYNQGNSLNSTQIQSLIDRAFLHQELLQQVLGQQP